MTIRIVFFMFSFLSIIVLNSCGSETKNPPVNPTKSVKKQYECPMKCTEEVFENPGQCPVCEMDLVELLKG